MVQQRVKIDGVIYGNVGEIKTKKTVDYYHKVRTLDGKLHEEIRYELTGNTVLFYNLLDGVYDSLKNFIKSNVGNHIVCGFPKDNADIDDDNGFEEAEYSLTISDEINKGYLRGKYFRNGLVVEFEAVNADE